MHVVDICIVQTNKGSATLINAYKGNDIYKKKLHIIQKDEAQGAIDTCATLVGFQSGENARA